MWQGLLSLGKLLTPLCHLGWAQRMREPGRVLGTACWFLEGANSETQECVDSLPLKGDILHPKPGQEFWGVHGLPKDFGPSG